MEAEVERAPTELVVVERPVDSAPTLLVFVLMPEEADVDSEPT